MLMLFCGWPGASIGGDSLFDVPALSGTPLDAKTLRVVERKGIITEEVRFHSETDCGKDVEIFAFFSYPRGASRLPAFIWNPGGLGQASPGFTEPPARRGYAVLCIDFPQPGYRSTGGYPINRGLELAADPKKSPIFHGAVALLKAVSYLETRPEVDKSRIGMAGSSWGAFFTTLMVGIDPRLKAGSCLYGTGNLQLGNAWWDGVSRMGRIPPPPEERERWRTTLDPAWRLPTKKTPIAWFTGTNDAFYSMPALMKSYEMAGGPKHLSLLPNWDHAMPPVFSDEHVYAWLDVYLRGKPPFVRVSPVAVHSQGPRSIARWTFDGPAVRAELLASYGAAGNWRGRFWHTFKAEISGNACRAVVPKATVPCYVSGTAIDARGIRSSTPIVRVEGASPGHSGPPSLPDYDGCSEWGGFEESQMAFLARHNRSGQARWIPRLSREAKDGKYAAILKPHETVLPPILSTAGVPHRFSCFLKADLPCVVDVDLAGEHKEFAVDREWMEAAMDLTPPNSLMGTFSAIISAPSDIRVLVDSIRFRPVGSLH